MIKDKPYIIAEIGINHEGRLDYITKLIYAAKRSGANAVKFQIFKAETLADKYSKVKKFYYNKKNLETLYKMWKRLELNDVKLNRINNLSKKLNIDLIFSIFDAESLKKLKGIKYNYIKVASSDINDFPLLEKLRKINKKLIVSTGMANFNEIQKTVNFLNKKNIYLLHCVSLYPCPINKINVNRMLSLKKKFKSQIGFSDHSIGINACLLALSKGANIIEKHFTLNKKLEGPDHALSADEYDLKLICEFAKNITILSGNGKISPTIEELKIKELARKSIYVKKGIFKNERFTEKNLEIRRPKGFIDPIFLDQVINRISTKNIKAGTSLKANHIKNFN